MVADAELFGDEVPAQANAAVRLDQLDQLGLFFGLGLAGNFAALALFVAALEEDPGFLG
ncbi:hypothetical protein D3C81_2306190 [compost metagenome]